VKSAARPKTMLGRKMSRKALVIAMAVAAIAALFTGVAAMHDDPVNTGEFDSAPAGSQPCTGVPDTFGPDMNCPSGISGCSLTGSSICDRYTWEFDNYVYLEQDGMPYLPAPFTGIPRVDISTNEEFKGQMDFSSAYMGAIAGQLLPGLVIAVLLFLSMILCLFFYILSSCCKCLGCCKCCFRPTPYTRKALHVAKGIQLLFVMLCFCGCVIIFVKSPDLGDGIRDITNGLLDSTEALLDDVEDISDAIGSLESGASSELTGGFTDLQTSSESVRTTMKDLRSSIDGAVEKINLGADITAGILLGVAFITMALSILNFWRLLILFSVLTSIILVLTWIVVGFMAAIGVFLQDFCFTIDQYLINPESVEISKEIPCPDPGSVIEFGDAFRKQIRDSINVVNDGVYNKNVNAGGQNDYICAAYEGQTIGDLCGSAADIATTTFVSPLWDDPYSNYVCKNYHNGNLGSSYTASTTVYPKWDCRTNGYKDYRTTDSSGTLSSVDFTSNSRKNKVALKDASTTYASLFGPSSTEAKNLNDLATLNAVIPKFEDILQCGFIRDMFESIQSGCHGTADAVVMLWNGFIVTAVGYLCLWITMLVTIGRMSNSDLMIDGGHFDAKKAGLI
jgi:hypothetical protein